MNDQKTKYDSECSVCEANLHSCPEMGLICVPCLALERDKAERQRDALLEALKMLVESDIEVRLDIALKVSKAIKDCEEK